MPNAKVTQESLERDKFHMLLPCVCGGIESSSIPSALHQLCICTCTIENGATSTATSFWPSKCSIAVLSGCSGKNCPAPPYNSLIRGTTSVALRIVAVPTRRLTAALSPLDPAPGCAACAVGLPANGRRTRTPTAVLQLMIVKNYVDTETSMKIHHYKLV